MRLSARLRVKYKRRSDTYDICRFVHIALRFDRKNLFLVIKFKQPTDLYKYLKIRLTDQEKEVDSNSSSVLLGQNVLQLLQQFNAITTVNLVNQKGGSLTRRISPSFPKRCANRSKKACLQPSTFLR